MRARNMRSFGLRFEQLESRALFAGDVFVGVSRGQLAIMGDAADNAIRIASGAAAGEYVITGVPTGEGVATKVNGAASFTARGVMGAAIVDLRGGNDSLSASNLALQCLKIADSAGDNTVNLSGATISGDLTLMLSGAGGHIQLKDSSVSRSLFVTTGAAGDDVELDNVTVGRAATISTGLGNDRVSIDNSKLQGALLLNTTATPPVLQQLRLEAGPADDDQVVISDTSVAGPATISLGDGTNSAELTDVKTLDTLYLSGGRDVDNFTLTRLNATGRVTVSTWAGNDTVAIRDSVFAAVALFAVGDDDDTLAISGSTFQGRTTVAGGRGLDLLTSADNVFAFAPLIWEVETQN